MEKEIINIVYYSEVIDSWGREESSTNPKVIHRILNNSAEFTDDMVFENEYENPYSIDDLIGKTVKIEGFDEFIVNE